MLRSQFGRSDRGSIKPSDGSNKYIAVLRNTTKRAAKLNRMNYKLTRKSTLLANTLRKKITKMNSLTKSRVDRRKRSLFEKHKMLTRLSSMTKTIDIHPLTSEQS